MRRIDNEHTKGFTIVELLIVIVVIGILAAITIVAFGGIQDRAKATVLKSDLTQAAQQIAVYKAGNASELYPPDLATAGLRSSSDTTFQYTVNNNASPPTFCLTATSVGYFGKAFNLTQDGGVNEGACPGQSPTGTPNLIANSSMETPGGTIVTRTNYAKDPSAANSVGYFNSVGSAPAPSSNSIASDKSHTGSTSYKRAITGTGQLAGVAFIDNNSLQVSAGDILTWSFWVYSTKAGIVSPYAEGSKISDSTYMGFGGGTDSTIPANTWTKVTGKGTSPTDAYINRVGAYNMSVVAGDTAWFDDFLVEKTGSIDGYFDGSTIASGDFTYGWSGIANASTSVQRATAIASASINRVSAIQSKDWSSAGSRSVRLIPNSSSSRDSYFELNNLISGGVSSLKPNTTYTIKAKLRLPQALTGSLMGGTQQLSIFVHLNNSSRGTWVAPNTPGEYVLGGTFTTPAVFTGYNSIRLYHGGLVGAGDVWWDDILLVEGDYAGTYFE